MEISRFGKAGLIRTEGKGDIRFLPRRFVAIAIEYSQCTIPKCCFGQISLEEVLSPDE